MATARATAGARLHFGFGNLSLAGERLYGGIGAALDEPRVVVEAEPDSTVACDDPVAREYARRVVDLLELDGASVTVREALPRHVGLGSGTQLALATLAAIARAHDRPIRVRDRAPALGRGGRSGVGVAGFEGGGFVLDAGHPTELFTTARPADGEWTVPAVVARHPLPEEWRFVIALPDGARGRSGEAEDAALRDVVERADPDIADEIAGVCCRRLLPAAAEGDRERFGSAVAEIGRLNGAWYAEEQGGVYRPPAGAIVERLGAVQGVTGAGQSSWGPAVYGVADESTAPAASEAAREALDDGGGEVIVAKPRNGGATIERAEGPKRP